MQAKMPSPMVNTLSVRSFIAFRSVRFLSLPLLGYRVWTMLATLLFSLSKRYCISSRKQVNSIALLPHAPPPCYGSSDSWFHVMPCWNVRSYPHASAHCDRESAHWETFSLNSSTKFRLLSQTSRKLELCVT